MWMIVFKTDADIKSGNMSHKAINNSLAMLIFLLKRKTKPVIRGIILIQNKKLRKQDG